MKSFKVIFTDLDCQKVTGNDWTIQADSFSIEPKYIRFFASCGNTQKTIAMVYRVDKVQPVEGKGS